MDLILALVGVDGLHGVLELFLVEPRLVRLHQAQHLDRLHVPAVVLVKNLEHLLELQRRHLDLFPLRVVPVHQRVDLLGQLEGARLAHSLVRAAVLVLAEQAQQELVALLLELVD